MYKATIPTAVSHLGELWSCFVFVSVTLPRIEFYFLHWRRHIDVNKILRDGSENLFKNGTKPFDNFMKYHFRYVTRRLCYRHTVPKAFRWNYPTLTSVRVGQSRRTVLQLNERDTSSRHFNFYSVCAVDLSRETKNFYKLNTKYWPRFPSKHNLFK
jgi:hypothetical protein